MEIIENNQKRLAVSLLLIIVIQTSFTSIQTIAYDEIIEPFFTLKSIWTSATYEKFYSELYKELGKIGINIDVVIKPSAEYFELLLGSHNFDLAFRGLSAEIYDPDFTGFYNEEGQANLFGYDSSMDYDANLGTGINEWYIKNGTLIIPPNSVERVQHYWNWEQYMMDEICPMLPMYNSYDHIIYWSNLNGYNHSKGLLQSWGDMSWNSLHLGQDNTDEIVISDASWTNLNPLFQEDISSRIISDAVMDPLIWFDFDMTVWPHLAKSFTYLNDSTIEITTREGIKWGVDSEGNFTNEYFDVKDVYFTLYCWKYLSDNQLYWDWIKSMEIIDKQTMRLYIDGNSSTPEIDPFPQSLERLFVRILPEHYLNQSQLADGFTPNINHTSWSIFEIQPFGTSLFSLKDYTPDTETILEVRPDYWGINKTITADPALNWSTRFGNFTDIMNQLRIRIIPDIQTAKYQFLNGYLDLFSIISFPELREELSDDMNFKIQSIPNFAMTFMGFNMRENRGPIGSRELCPNDESMTIGLAIRKAICYAIDKEKINNIQYDGERRIIYWPIYEKLGIWCNPNIIKYDYNFTKACELMAKAGYYLPGYSPSQTPSISSSGSEIISFGIISIMIICVSILKNKRKKKC